jgi:hypothetical protein
MKGGLINLGESGSAGSYFLSPLVEDDDESFGGRAGVEFDQF